MKFYKCLIEENPLRSGNALWLSISTVSILYDLNEKEFCCEFKNYKIPPNELKYRERVVIMIMVAKVKQTGIDS